MLISSAWALNLPSPRPTLLTTRVDILCSSTTPLRGATSTPIDGLPRIKPNAAGRKTATPPSGRSLAVNFGGRSNVILWGSTISDSSLPTAGTTDVFLQLQTYAIPLSEDRWVHARWQDACSCTCCILGWHTARVSGHCGMNRLSKG